jgi:glucokinase
VNTTRNHADVIGVDIGGTKIAAGIVQMPEGRVVFRQEIPTRAERGGDAVLTDVELLLAHLSTGRKIQALGVGICEIVDRSGRLASECTIHWQHLPVTARLRRFAPLLLEADVRAAARAEATFGAGQRFESFLYVTIGTGISSCLVIKGEPWAGAHGAAGTMASGPLPHDTSASLEDLASGPALVRRFRETGGAVSSAQEVLSAATLGDEPALHIVTSAAALLGGTLGWMVNILDPQAIVIGGGLGLAEGLYHDLLVPATRRHIWWPGHQNLPIVRASCGNDAGIIGAAALAWEKAIKEEAAPRSAHLTSIVPNPIDSEKRQRGP